MDPVFFAHEGRVFRQLGDTPIFTSPREIEQFLAAWEAADASLGAKSLASELRDAMREAEAYRQQEAA